MLLNIHQNLKILHTKARQLTKEEFEDRHMQTFIQNMSETLMNTSTGIALTAVQVWEDESEPPPAIFIIRTEEKEITTFVNPVLVAATGRTLKDWEGCLSFPHRKPKKKGRHKNCTFSYTDVETWEPVLMKVTGKFARIIFHEISHILGQTIF